MSKRPNVCFALVHSQVPVTKTPRSPSTLRWLPHCPATCLAVVRVPASCTQIFSKSCCARAVKSSFRGPPWPDGPRGASDRAPSMAGLCAAPAPFPGSGHAASESSLPPRPWPQQNSPAIHTPFPQNSLEGHDFASRERSCPPFTDSTAGPPSHPALPRPSSARGRLSLVFISHQEPNSL